jgi:transposase, IS5 family
MRRRRIGQLGFAEAGVRAVRGRDTLGEIGRLVDWAPIEQLLDGIHASRRGEPAYPPLMMFKVLLLQRWHGLSDPQMEAALADRLSFLRFAGLSLEDETPDHSTIWRFREHLTKQNLVEEVFAAVMRQLTARGLVLRQGTLIDASLVSSAARRPRVKEGPTSPTDRDARFGAANERRRYVFGYKAHVAVDAGSGLVRALITTPANVQEIAVASQLVPDDAGTVYADRGYDAGHFRDALAARGLGCGVMRRARKNKPLDEAEQCNNKALSLVRRNVERVFAEMKRHYGMARMRAFSLARNHVDLTLFAIALNLRRCARLATP